MKREARVTLILALQILSYFTSSDVKRPIFGCHLLDFTFNRSFTLSYMDFGPGLRLFSRLIAQDHLASRSAMYSKTLRNLSQVITGHRSICKPLYRRCRAGRRVRVRTLNIVQPITASQLTHDDLRSSSSSAYRGVNKAATTRTVNLHNLRSLPRAPTSYPSSKLLNFANVNTQSIRNKVADVSDHVIESKIDLCAITETWVKDQDTFTVASLNSVDGYAFKYFPRLADRQGGGTGLMYRDNLKVKFVNGHEHKSFEFSMWNIGVDNKNINLIIIYRPPYSPAHRVPASVFFQEFSSFLEEHVLCPQSLLITGDFNFHLDVLSDYETKKFNDILCTFGLTQHVTVPTHVSGHTLDPIITRCSNDIVINCPYTTLTISDHSFVLCKLGIPRPHLQVKEVTYRNLKNISLEAFKDDINSSALINKPPDTLTDLVQCYNDSLEEVLDKHAPRKTKVLVVRPKVPWYTDDLKQLKSLRRKLERKLVKSNSENTRRAYAEIRAKYSSLLNQARKVYYTSLIDNCEGDSKKLFRVVNSLCSHKRQSHTWPSQTAYHHLANAFGEFFVKKISIIQEKIGNTDITQPLVQLEAREPDVKLSEFSCVSEEEIIAIIGSSSSTSCRLDPIPTPLLKQSVDVLARVITGIINLSLKEGVVPNDWKVAHVTPLLKKAGLAATFNNFRPVSNLAFISKILEKVVLHQILSHCSNFAPLPVNQSSYRQFHSTETALLKVQSDILMNMDKQEITLLVLLDLSAAFDTIDHGILLDILERDFGITDSALKWIKSYISSRRQCIIVDDSTSKEFDIDCGIPQGSCLGPILFLLYSSKLFQIASSHLPEIHGFADDTQLYLSFKPDEASSQEAILRMEHCISDMRSWMISNRLLINDSKTEFLIIGSRQQLSKVNISCVRVGDSLISSAKNARNLGAWFDSSMSMEVHISKTCGKAFRGLYNIRQIRKFLTPDSTKTLVHAFVTSHIDYCNSLLFGLPRYHLDRLQKVLNAAARLIHLVPKFAHITSTLMDLHWLPVEFRIQYKILLLVHKCLHGQAPQYLSQSLFIKPPGKYNLRRTQQPASLIIPRTKCKSFGDRSFNFSGPFLWNNLPNELKLILNIDSFKKQLKTYLFRKAYQLM